MSLLLVVFLSIVTDIVSYNTIISLISLINLMPL